MTNIAINNQFAEFFKLFLKTMFFKTFITLRNFIETFTGYCGILAAYFYNIIL